MSYLKTKVSDKDVLTFLSKIEDDTKREDCLKLVSMIKDITNLEPKLWGERIVGFGDYAYKTKAGKVGEWFLIGLTPTKTNISLHLMFGLDKQDALLSHLGKFKMGKGCLYLKKLSDVDENVLEQLMISTYKSMKEIAK